MSDALVLFCGGPPIYGGVPKPLQILPTGETLLECYLRFIQPIVPTEIVLLIEQTFEPDFSRILNSFDYSSKITTLTCSDNSSTLSKLQSFLKSGYPMERTVVCSYPDMFVFGEIVLPDITDPRLGDKVFISSAPIISRFPRLIVDPYDSTVRGISNHTSFAPANPLHVFGGHLLARVGVMNNLVETFLSDIRPQSASLEFDMFFWLVNTARICSMPINGRWIQADSPREISTILSLC